MATDWSSIPTPQVGWLPRPSPGSGAGVDASGTPDEPYLATGLDGVTLTPYRADDVRDMVILSNIPAVARWSFRREYP